MRSEEKKSIENAVEVHKLRGVITHATPPFPGSPKWAIGLKRGHPSQQYLSWAQMRTLCWALGAEAKNQQTTS